MHSRKLTLTASKRRRDTPLALEWRSLSLAVETQISPKRKAASVRPSSAWKWWQTASSASITVLLFVAVFPSRNVAPEHARSWAWFWNPFRARTVSPTSQVRNSSEFYARERETARSNSAENLTPVFEWHEPSDLRPPLLCGKCVALGRWIVLKVAPRRVRFWPRSAASCGGSICWPKLITVFGRL